MTKDEESAFRRWWCNYEITRKEKSEIVAKDAFCAGVSALMLVKQTLENDNTILRKCIAELEKKNAELKLKLEALEGETPWKDIKDKSEVIKENTELKARNEKMKCCGNCKHYKPVVTVNESISNMCEDYYDGCNNNIYEPYNKWELKEK